MAITVQGTEDVKEVVENLIAKLNQQLWKVNHEVREPAFSQSTIKELTSTDLVKS
jgi:hypothetical protein